MKKLLAYGIHRRDGKRPPPKLPRRIRIAVFPRKFPRWILVLGVFVAVLFILGLFSRIDRLERQRNADRERSDDRYYMGQQERGAEHDYQLHQAEEQHALQMIQERRR